MLEKLFCLFVLVMKSTTPQLP